VYSAADVALTEALKPPVEVALPDQLKRDATAWSAGVVVAVRMAVSPLMVDFNPA